MKKAIKIVAAASALTSLTSCVALAQTPNDADGYLHGPQMMWWGGGWYAMIFGPVLMILMLATLIAPIILLVRWLGGPWHGIVQPHQTSAGRAPLDILKERFARGEIDKQEFEERRRVLGD